MFESHLHIFNISLQNLSQKNLDADPDLDFLHMLNLIKTTSICINFALIILGLLSNFFVILVFLRCEMRKLTISIYTISLAVSDIFLITFPIFLNWLHEYNPDFVYFKTTFWCKTNGYLDITFVSWSAWNVVALSKERWMSVCQTSKINLHSEKFRFAIKIVISIPIISVVAFIWYPLIFDILDEEDLEKISNIKILPNSYDESPCKPINSKLYMILGIIAISIAYVLPFFLIAAYNINVMKTLNARIKKKKVFGNYFTYLLFYLITILTRIVVK